MFHLPTSMLGFLHSLWDPFNKQCIGRLSSLAARPVVPLPPVEVSPVEAFLPLLCCCWARPELPGMGRGTVGAGFCMTNILVIQPEARKKERKNARKEARKQESKKSSHSGHPTIKAVRVSCWPQPGAAGGL